MSERFETMHSINGGYINTLPFLFLWLGWTQVSIIGWRSRTPKGKVNFGGCLPTDDAHIVCVCLCACVGHTHRWVKLCKNDWTDRDAIWGRDLCSPKEPKKGKGRILLWRYLCGNAATSRAVQSQEVAVDWQEPMVLEHNAAATTHTTAPAQ